MFKYIWKFLGILLLIYAIIGGFLIDIPQTNIGETLRNIFYHVGMWFGMMAVMIFSFISSIRFLNKNNPIDDTKAAQSAQVGVLFGILGIVTGMVWAGFTWGQVWGNDPHLNGAALTILMYFAYFILRSSIDDEEKRGRVAAVYNIFAFVMMVVFVGILPRMAKTGLHPGTAEGNPIVDIDPTMRLIFYPALIGWIILALWIANVKSRYKCLKNELDLKKIDSQN